MENKKVIFIGGTSYSGTTIFGMILANDEKGFSGGEMSALFKPQKAHHFDPKCGCGNKKCEIWPMVLKNGISNIYETIFSKFPNIRFIVDSSKDPFWIHYQNKILKKNKIEAKNVLIYKTPLEAAFSFKKRGRLAQFKKSWINYHRLYFSLVKDFRTISYKQLTTNYIFLAKICNYLEIPYFDNKEQFWNKTQHTIFGNSSAKIHLYDGHAIEYVKCKERIMKYNKRKMNFINEHRRIYYKDVNDAEVKKFLQRKSKKSEKMQLIADILKEEAVENKNYFYHNYRNKAKMPKIMVGLRHLNNTLHIMTCRYRNGYNILSKYFN